MVPSHGQTSKAERPTLSAPPMAAANSSTDNSTSKLVTIPTKG